MPVAVTHLYVRGRGSATRLIFMFLSYQVFFGFHLGISVVLDMLMHDTCQPVYRVSLGLHGVIKPLR